LAVFLEREDVVGLLRVEVDKAGGQVAWSKKTGVNRNNLNRVLKGRRPLPETILIALNLRVAYTRNVQAAPFGHRPQKRSRGGNRMAKSGAGPSPTPTPHVVK
jgi:hypothetical protein